MPSSSCSSSTSSRFQPQPEWLRQRAIGKRQRGGQRVSIESMRRLSLEARLEGHFGCVNCLEWNQSGNLLASGSDDRNVIIWDPFKGTIRNTIKTGHRGNVFSVKFIPNSNDHLIATCASDNEVKLISVIGKDNIMNCKTCHSDRVKRLAVHPNEPNLIWSAGEDGYIMQYDRREEHVCKNPRPNNLLIDLNTSGSISSAKCLALNPIRDEVIAIGSHDSYIRLFDRRYASQRGLDSCTAYFAPGHLLDHQSYKTISQSFGTTYLSFSPDGSELLANIHAEHVYLFNTYEPWEPYKSFDSTIKPLVMDLPQPNERKKFRMKPFSQWRELKRIDKSVTLKDLPEKYSDFCESLKEKLKSNAAITMENFNQLNELMAKTKNCVELYHLRAKALIQRNWKGDYYEAIKDCCCALALNPLDLSTLENLSLATWYLGDREVASKLLGVIRSLQQQDKGDQELCFNNEDEENHSRLRQAAIVIGTLVRCSADLDKSMPRPYAEHPALGQEASVESDHHSDYNSNLDTMRMVNALFGISNPRQQSNATMLSLSQSRRSSNQPMDLQDDETSRFSEQDRLENERRLKAFDYSKRFCGHRNLNTDIKEVNFFGDDGEFIIAGSDDGAFYIWDKETTNIVKAVTGDVQILNCLQPHPSICMLATSGIEPSVKLWSPSGKTSHDVKSLESQCFQNQDFITDPLEAMIGMLYSERDN